jgi:hypothetical protein
VKLYLRRLRTRSDLKITSLKLTVKVVVLGGSAACGSVGAEWNGGGEEDRRPRSSLIGGGGGSRTKVNSFAR